MTTENYRVCNDSIFVELIRQTNVNIYMHFSLVEKYVFHNLNINTTELLKLTGELHT